MVADLLSFLRINLFSILTIGLTSYFVYLLASYAASVVRKRRAFKDFPEPKEGKHWLWGHMFLMVGMNGKQRLETSLRFAAQHPKLYVVRSGLSRMSVVVHHPDTIKVLLKGTDPKPTGYGGPYRHALPWLGEGLLLAGGKRWARSRRLLTPAFHFDILKPYIKVYKECAERLSTNINAFVSDGRKFEIFNLVSLCTLDIILRCAFSYETDCQKNSEEIHPYVKAVHEISEAWARRNRRLWLHPDFIFYSTESGRRFKKNCVYVHGVADGVIQSRKQALKTVDISSRRYLDFLDILLTAKDENGVGLSDIEVQNEVDTFLFEGHDTTASAISWVLYSLALYPEHQRKCQEEIDNILRDRENKEITWDDLGQLEYLAMCIKEGMRLHVPVPFIARRNVKPLVMDGLTIPADTLLVAHIYSLHNNPAVWEDPSEYRPERFSKDNIEKRDSFAFLPFSAGPRNCIGQHFAMNEEKVVIAKLLRRFNFKLDPSHNVQKAPAAVMRAEHGIYMYADNRNL